MTDTSRGRIYTLRLRGCGRPILWDEDKGGGTGTPTYMGAVTGNSGAAALFFARLNGWDYLGRTIANNGDILDWYATPRDQWALAWHTRYGTVANLREETVDLLPEPWIRRDPGTPPFIGYVVRIPFSTS